MIRIGFTADDGRGGRCTGSLQAAVPLTLGQTPVDDEALFDATQAAP